MRDHRPDVGWQFFVRTLIDAQVVEKRLPVELRILPDRYKFCDCFRKCCCCTVFRRCSYLDLPACRKKFYCCCCLGLLHMIKRWELLWKYFFLFFTLVLCYVNILWPVSFLVFGWWNVISGFSMMKFLPSMFWIRFGWKLWWFHKFRTLFSLKCCIILI